MEILVVFVIIFVLFVFGLGIYLMIFAPSKGAQGETSVSMFLATLPKPEYRVFNDVMIQRQNGTAQIDHVVVSPYGIFVPIVVFFGEAKLRVKTKSYVTYPHGTTKIIRSFNTKKLDSTQVDMISSSITSGNVNNEQNRERHIQNVQNQINHSQASIQNNLCPKCGGKLVLRKGKYGQFRGCSNYPKCTFTSKGN